jgi:hypothetical protein
MQGRHDLRFSCLRFDKIQLDVLPVLSLIFHLTLNNFSKTVIGLENMNQVYVTFKSTSVYLFK